MVNWLLTQCTYLCYAKYHSRTICFAWICKQTCLVITGYQGEVDLTKVFLCLWSSWNNDMKWFFQKFHSPNSLIQLFCASYYFLNNRNNRWTITAQVVVNSNFHNFFWIDKTYEALVCAILIHALKILQLATHLELPTRCPKYELKNCRRTWKSCDSVYFFWII